MTNTPIADRKYTIEQLLDRSGRALVPLERTFVQRRVDNNRPAPGPLAEFVRRSRETALEQYLVLHATASNNEEGLYDVRLPAATWARVIGAYFDPKTGVVDDAGLHAVSRNWSFLKDLRLVDSERVQRRSRVWLLADDGEGGEYRHPGQDSKGKKLTDGPGYLQLPYAYWREGYHVKLTLPGKALLLIALSLGDGFPLPAGQMPTWYGISAATAERGLAELHSHGLLYREKHRRPEIDSPVGFTDLYYYELLPPFGPRGALSASAHEDWTGLAMRPQPAKPGRKRKVTPGAKGRAFEKGPAKARSSGDPRKVTARRRPGR